MMVNMKKIHFCKALGLGVALLTASAVYLAPGKHALAQDFSMPSLEGFSTSDGAGGDSSAPANSNEQSSNESAVQEKLRKEAFGAALKQLLPLRPEEIRTVLESYDRTTESAELPVHPYPRPEFAVQNIPLDPGAKPVVISTAVGYVTTFNVLDASGKPWPIEDISWVGDFDIDDASSKKAINILRITPQSAFAHGNVSMRLVGLDTPIILTLETNRDFVHYRFDAVIPKYGPSADAPLIEQQNMVSAGDAAMSGALEGVLPDGAKKLNVSGADGRTSAYRYHGTTYLRTPLTLLSPGWNSSVTSADGTHVYALPNTPVLLMSDRGQMVRAYLSDREDTANE